jgi:hypothetical protein
MYRDIGERYEIPQRDSGGAPAANDFVHLTCSKFLNPMICVVYPDVADREFHPKVQISPKILA